MVTEMLDYHVYTVGWICIASTELNVARGLLDEEHENLPPKPKDDNNYLLGRMNGHNAVIGVPWIRPLRLSQRLPRRYQHGEDICPHPVGRRCC